MKNIKGYISYINENYPPGSENDPNAPWNSKEPDVQYPNVGTKGGNRFSLIGSDFSEHLLAKDQQGNLYIGYFDPSDLKEYAPYERTYIGRDEDGDPDYDYEYLDLDGDSLEAYLSELTDKEIGEGLDDWEAGTPLVKMDEELAKEIYNDFRRWAKDSRFGSSVTGFYLDTTKEILKKFPDLETLIDLGGIDIPK